MDAPIRTTPGYEFDELSSRHNLSTSSPDPDVQTKPPLFTRWIDILATFFRTIGLKVISFLWKSNNDENPKVLIRKSRRVALAKCAVHFIPALLTIGLVALNFVGYFIGADLEGAKHQESIKLGALQIATKVQELLIVASIGSVVFHALRSEIIFGPGLPLGLLVSGFSFSSIAYLLSPEFLGGAKQSFIQIMSGREKLRRLFFIGLIVISSLLALLAAPATAVLMIPRIKDWNVGGGAYWLTGESEYLWPEMINASYYTGSDCAGGEAHLNPECPSSAYMPLFTYFDNWWLLDTTSITKELLDPFIRKTLYIRPANVKEADTWAYTTHHATSVLQDAVRGMHISALKYLSLKWPDRKPFPTHLTWASLMRYETMTHVPAARVLCNAHGVMNFDGDNLNLKFPDADEKYRYYKSHGPNTETKIPGLVDIDVLGDVKTHLVERKLLNNAEERINSSIFNNDRSVIIAPVDIWSVTNSSLGIVILLKDTWNSTVGTPLYTTNAIACSVDARWAKAKSVQTGVWEDWVPHEYYAGRILSLVRTELELNSRIGYIPFSAPRNESLKPIRMSTDWYDMLSPSIPDTLPNGVKQLPFIGTKMTTLEALVKTRYHSELSQIVSFESIIAANFVEGLSRCGLSRNRIHSAIFHEIQMNESLARSLVHTEDIKKPFPKPNKPGNLTPLEMKAVFTGYVMTCDSWFDWMCNIGLLFYAAIALAHSVYILVKGETSEAWDSVLELAVLCSKSTPPPEPVLSNTAVAVHSFRTVKSLAWVEVAGGGLTDDGTNGDLRLRIGDVSERRNGYLKPSAGSVYG